MWPFARGVIDPQHLHAVAPDSVRHYVGRAGHDQFPGAGNAAGTAKALLFFEQGNGSDDLQDLLCRRCWFVSDDVSLNFVEIEEGKTQPSNLQLFSPISPAPRRDQ